jgi:hypothetical protein
VYQSVFTKLPVLQKDPITGIEEELNIEKFVNASIYPNPAQNYFNVSLSDELTLDMEWVIVNQLGVQLKSGKFESGENNYEVDTRSIPNGLHMFIISGGDDYKTIRKIVIQR